MSRELLSIKYSRLFLVHSDRNGSDNSLSFMEALASSLRRRCNTASQSLARELGGKREGEGEGGGGEGEGGEGEDEGGCAGTQLGCVCVRACVCLTFDEGGVYCPRGKCQQQLVLCLRGKTREVGVSLQEVGVVSITWCEEVPYPGLQNELGEHLRLELQIERKNQISIINSCRLITKLGLENHNTQIFHENGNRSRGFLHGGGVVNIIINAHTYPQGLTRGKLSKILLTMVHIGCRERMK